MKTFLKTGVYIYTYISFLTTLTWINAPDYKVQAEKLSIQKRKSTYRKEYRRPMVINSELQMRTRQKQYLFAQHNIVYQRQFLIPICMVKEWLESPVLQIMVQKITSILEFVTRSAICLQLQKNWPSSKSTTKRKKTYLMPINNLNTAFFPT